VNHTPTNREAVKSVAQEQTARRQQDNKRRYDKRFGSNKWRPFEPGEQVKLRNHERPEDSGPGSSKFRLKWRGPYIILQRRGVTYQICTGQTKRWVNASALRPWYGAGNCLNGRRGVERGAAISKTVSKKRVQVQSTRAALKRRRMCTGETARRLSITSRYRKGPDKPVTDQPEGQFDQTKSTVTALDGLRTGRAILPRGSKSTAMERIQNDACMSSGSGITARRKQTAPLGDRPIRTPK
jgi:hypothetical protein